MKTGACAINTQISQIKANHESEYAEKVLEILNPHVIEYIDASNKPLDLFESQPELRNYFKELEIQLTSMQKLHLSCWLSGQGNFISAIERVNSLRVIPENLPGINLNRSRENINRYVLEEIFAKVVCYLFPIAKHLRTTTFIPSEWKKLIQKEKGNLILMSRNFERSSEEQLFIHLINRLENSRGNLYNSGKPHALQLREMMTKRILQQLCNHPQLKDATHTLISDITLDLASIFFPVVNKRYEVQAMLKLVVQNLKEEKLFLQKTVKDLIFPEHAT